MENNVKLTGWSNEPTVDNLKQDLNNCKASYSNQVAIIDKYMDELRADNLKPRKDKTRSTVQPKLIRKQAEWRYAALTEPFLSENNIFRINPVTYEDNYSAKQNELVLNYQFNTQINKIKFIDDYIRAAVDCGTAIIRVGWEEYQDSVDVPNPIYQARPVDPDDDLGLARFNRVKKAFGDTITRTNIPSYWVECIKQAMQEEQQREQEVFAQVQQQLMILQQQGLPPEQMEQMHQEMMQQAQQQLEQIPPIAYVPEHVNTEYVAVSKTVNRPTAEICYYKDVYVDPCCEGNLDKAEFIIYKFTSCKADLLKDGRYQNIENIPEDAYYTFEDGDDHAGMENFKDPARKKLTVYEYWGNWDINGDGTKVAIVASWVGSTLIRCEENPYPDHKPPFVFVPYLPIANSVYGEPDGALIADNQHIIGAITRGIIDLLGRSANSQVGMAISFLDPVNKKAFNEGRDYEFNPAMPPQQAVFEHTYPEIPQTVIPFLQSQEMEAEALTGVKTYNEGITGDAYGNTATGIKSVLDSASKREMGILRRLSDGIKKIARKIMAMNALWLNDTEVIRITNQDFVEIRRDDLAGNFDLELVISSAEQDNAKAESLAFMLQTLGNSVDQGMTQMIFSEICRLKKMPELAERVARYEPPPPDPMQQQMMQMQMEMMKAQIQKLEAEVQKLGADAMYSEARAQSEMVEAQLKPQELQSKITSEQAKAQYNQSMAHKLDLDYLNDIQGTKHQQDMELMAQQAKAQADKSMQEKFMDYLLEQEKTKQAEAKAKKKGTL